MYFPNFDNFIEILGLKIERELFDNVRRLVDTL